MPIERAEREATAEKKPTTRLIIVASTTCTIRKFEAIKPRMPAKTKKERLLSFLFMHLIEINVYYLTTTRVIPET